MSERAQSGSAAPSEMGDDVPHFRDEETARTKFRHNQALATGLVSGMGVLFAATWLIRSPGFGTDLLRAGSEAGIVGGAADWFAVTALFRQPLGLPIPHTAILPNSKERIGRALASFVERGFLTEAVLLPRLRALHAGQRIAAWLASPENVQTLVAPTIAALPQILHAVEKGQFRDFLNQVVGDRLKTVELAPIAGRTLEVLTQSGEGDVLFEKTVGFFLHWLEANRAEIDGFVAQRSRWWVPSSVDRRIARTIVESITDLLNSLHQPDSGTRRKFRDALNGLITNLKTDPDPRQEWNAARDRLLQHPELRAWLNAVWTELTTALGSDLADPDSRTRVVLETAITSLGKVLASDPDMRARIDQAIERLTAQVVVRRGGIAAYMTDVIRNWDPETLSNRFELLIGSDLQFIRMNGTIVGFLVGCSLFLITRLLGG